MTVTHSHDHAANGSQGTDQTHSHEHTHKGDATHAHVHASPGKTPKGAAEMDFSDEQMAALRAKLGKADDYDLTADEILAALAEQGEPAKAGKLEAGQMVIDRDAWDAMTRRTERLEATAKDHERAKRDEVISAAVAAGKFALVSRPRYERMWDLDPDNARAVIASLRANVVPVDDVGQPGGPGDQMPDEYAHLFPPTYPRTQAS